MSSQANYKGSRIRGVKLINGYAAIQESFQYPFAESNNLYQVSTSNVDFNQIQKWEPVHRLVNYTTGSPLALACFNNYDQFRIRKVCVQFTPTVLNPVNAQRGEVYIYWCPNHKTFDEDEAKGETFSNMTDLSEAARIQKITVTPGVPFSIEVVPQITYGNTIMVGGVAVDQSGDGKIPWLENTTANSQLDMRFPIFYFRRPYAAIASISTQYQVMCTAIIEFRNMNDDN